MHKFGFQRALETRTDGIIPTINLSAHTEIVQDLLTVNDTASLWVTLASLQAHIIHGLLLILWALQKTAVWSPIKGNRVKI
jgi:hypothetical protein